MKHPSFLLVCSVFSITGCAHVDVHRLSESERVGNATTGVRFYQPWPYLVVTEETKDGVKQYTTSVIYLPRMSEEFVVDIKPGWGTVQGNFKLQDGWMLTDFGANADSKGPETIAAITGLITAVAGAGAGARPAAAPLQPGMYRIDFDKHGFASELVPVFR